MHEEDAGIAWKHMEYRTGKAEVRRLRRLVLSFVATVGAPSRPLYPVDPLLKDCCLSYIFKHAGMFWRFVHPALGCIHCQNLTNDHERSSSFEPIECICIPLYACWDWRKQYSPHLFPTLTVGCCVGAVNYEYAFYWYLYQVCPPLKGLRQIGVIWVLVDLVGPDFPSCSHW